MGKDPVSGFESNIVDIITMIATTATALLSAFAFLYVSIGQCPVVELVRQRVMLSDPARHDIVFIIRNRRSHPIYIRRIQFITPKGKIVRINEPYSNFDTDSYEIGISSAKIDCSYAIESKQSKEYTVEVFVSNALGPPIHPALPFPSVEMLIINVGIEEYSPYRRKYVIQHHPSLAPKGPRLQ